MRVAKTRGFNQFRKFSIIMAKSIVLVISCIVFIASQAKFVSTSPKLDREIFENLSFKPICSPPTYVYGYLLTLVLNLREPTLMMKLGSLLTQSLLSGSDEPLNEIPTIISMYPNFTVTYPLYLTRYKSSMHWSDLLSLLNAITCSLENEYEALHTEDLISTYKNLMRICVPSSSLKERIGCILENDGI